MSAPEIVVKNVSFSYNGNIVLDKINFSVMKRDFLGIIGPNGSGKTTLIRLLLGMMRPDSGDIRIFGKKPNEISKHIGYVSQETNINRDFPVTVRDVTLMGRLGATRWLLNYSRKDAEIARIALEQVDMWEFRDKRIGELSMGQRQRVFIARALTTQPKILILDEPTASIDLAGQSIFFDLLKKLNENLTILLVSHNLNTLLSYVSKVACVNKQLFFHDAPHVTSEMLNKTFGFSLEQICPLEPLPEKEQASSGHEPEGLTGD